MTLEQLKSLFNIQTNQDRTTQRKKIGLDLDFLFSHLQINKND